MTQSATIEPGQGLRERKRAATRAAISDAARSLTLEHGFSNFTVEQLCEQVGISRRTFFNYFPSKEDALLGHHFDGVPPELAEEFRQRGTTSEPGGFSGSLLADLIDLTCAMADQSALSREQYEELTAVLDREPALLVRIIGSRDRWEQEFAGLIAGREGLAADDPRVLTATSILSTLSYKAGRQYFSPANTDSYRAILTEYVAAARMLFTGG